MVGVDMAYLEFEIPGSIRPRMIPTIPDSKIRSIQEACLS